MDLTNATELNDAVSSDFNFQDSLDYTAPSSDHYMDDDTLGKLLAEVHRDYADYRRPEGVSVSPSSMSVMVDRTGELVERSDSDHFGFGVRNVYSAPNQFPVITQADRMVDRTGELVEKMIAEERESSSAQIRTLFIEQRKNDYRRMLRESFSSRTPCSSSRTRTQNSTGRIIAATTGFS